MNQITFSATLRFDTTNIGILYTKFISKNASILLILEVYQDMNMGLFQFALIIQIFIMYNTCEKILFFFQNIQSNIMGQVIRIENNFPYFSTVSSHIIIGRLKEPS